MFMSFGLVTKPSDKQKEGWYFLKADDALGDYYNWFARKGLFAGWQPCMNGCHVTFIAGEKDDRIIKVDEIDPYIGLEIEFYYTNQVWTNGQAFWLPVLAPKLDDIRRELGLKPRFLYHVTIGNIKHLK